MTTNLGHKYPVGIQTFSEIIEGGFLYVDKTDLVWNLTRVAKYIFFSRPRRFGKSLLTSTLKSYFEGRKDLFEGLKMMQLEQEWTEYPVFHIDISRAKAQENSQALQETLMWILSPYTELYGKSADETTPGTMLCLMRPKYTVW